MMALLSSLGQKIAGLLKERVDYGVATDAPSQRLINQYFERFSIHTLLPYQSYDPATQLFYNDRSIGFVLETSPLVGCTAEMQREISGLFQHTLPEGSSIQFMLWADPRIGGILGAWQEGRQQTPEIFQTLAQRRVKFLESAASLRNFRCIVSYSQPQFTSNSVEEHRLLQFKEQITTALKTLGMPLVCWDARDLINTLDGLVNFNQQTEPADLKWNPYQTFRGCVHGVHPPYHHLYQPLFRHSNR